MKKIAITLSLMLSVAIASLSSINKSSVLKGDVEALSLQEFNFGSCYLICLENSSDECFALLPQYDPDEPEYYMGSNGSSILFIF